MATQKPPMYGMRGEQLHYFDNARILVEAMTSKEALFLSFRKSKIKLSTAIYLQKSIGSSSKAMVTSSSLATWQK